VVIESRHHGGSLYTANAAMERGIPVGVVPGSIRSPTSVGTNALLADGAFPVRDLDDVLAALSLLGLTLPIPTTGAAAEPDEPLEPDLEALLAALSPDPTSLDQLARLTGLDLPALCGGLERLARAGRARDTGGWWERA
jgi:DNA processing protein